MRKAREVKDKARIVFGDACFTLHKWHSDAPKLEADQSSAEDTEEATYAKQQLGSLRGTTSRILGLPWNKERDIVSVEVPTEQAKLTKRGILAKLARIYDRLGLISPETFRGKLIYRAVCDSKRAWDAELSRDMAKAWVKWESGLPQSFEVPRSLAVHREEIEGIELHSFGDASAKGVAACVYAVIRQAAGINQGLNSARSRLSKQGLTIPRLELVAGHMAVNLITNVREALEGLPLTSMHCWLDSSVALYWIRGQGEHKQFVSNRVQKINSHHGVTWRYVPTAENPADLGSRGGRLEEADQWWNGPKWLASRENWPADILDEPTEESKAQAKLFRKVLAVAVHEEDDVEGVLRKFHLRKAVRVCAWMRRFAHNALRSRGKTRIEGPLTTQETKQLRLHWERQAQKSGEVEKDRVGVELAIKSGRPTRVSGPIAGSLPSVFTRNQPIFPTNRGRSPPANFARESGANDDQRPKLILDP